jgi:adenosylhomocysteine nucleosidase
LLAFVAAEAREFSGVLRNAERVTKLNWPLDFARMVWLNGRAAVLVANGPGPKLAGQAVEIARGRQELNGLVSTGFCGALDPALKPLDIFIPTEILDLPSLDRDLQTRTQSTHYQPSLDRDLPSRDRQGASIIPVTTKRPYQTGKLLSLDHVASTSAEKSELRKQGAGAIEMEAAAVSQKAREYNLPFYCIRVVTDTSTESFPLDFNLLRDTNGRFSRTKILAAAFRRPTAFPALIKLNNRCKDAAQALGDFIADTRF